MNRHFSVWVLESKIMPNTFDDLFEEISKWGDQSSPLDIIQLAFQKAFNKVAHQIQIPLQSNHYDKLDRAMAYRNEKMVEVDGVHINNWI